MTVWDSGSQRLTVRLQAMNSESGLSQMDLHGLNILTGFRRNELLKGVKGRDPSEEVNRAVWERDSENLTWECGRWKEGRMRNRVCLPLFAF